MDNIYNTVSTIFRERYGAQLFIEEKLFEKKKRPHFNSRWQSPFVYSRTHKQVTFPIFNSKRELQAIATASPVDNQDAIIFDEMAQFLQLTIAEHFELTTQLDEKIQTEMAIEKAHADTKKVIPLKTKKKNPNGTIEFKKRTPAREPDLRPLWITGDDEDIKSHIAFSVHDWTSNWAFINAKEIPDLVWEDQSSWSTFPQITIFIPDVTKLDAQKREKLKNNLLTLQKQKGPKPFIIVTSPKEVPEDLKELQVLFKSYNANTKNKPQVQAHFLLFHHDEKLNGTHFCDKTKDLFFLPFSPTPDKLH